MQGMSIERIIYNECVIKIFDSELEKFHLLETGGILLGYVLKKTIYIEIASGPGTRAIHEPYYFKADPDYIDMFIDMEIANSGGKLRYIGEWHSHLQIVPEPSNLDLNSISEIAESSNDLCSLLIIGAFDFKVSSFLQQSISIIKYSGKQKFYSLPSAIYSRKL